MMTSIDGSNTLTGGALGTVENALRPVVVKLSEGTEGRKFLLAELFMRDEHNLANHPQSEESSDPPDAYIRSLVERVRARHQPPDKSSSAT
jgi:hypothetical protein